jgi:hypothetical protein
VARVEFNQITANQAKLALKKSNSEWFFPVPDLRKFRWLHRLRLRHSRAQPIPCPGLASAVNAYLDGEPPHNVPLFSLF